ncbi:MAG: HD domain-containing phosphohydrolase [Candidatus Omnitrophota bacterium]
MENNSAKEQNGMNSVLWGFFFEKLLQNIAALVAVVDSAGGIVFANGKYLEYFSLSEKDAYGKDWIDSILPVARRTEIRAMFDNVKGTDIPVRFEMPSGIESGPGKHISWSGIPLKEKEFMLYMFIGYESSGIKGRPVKVYGLDKVGLDETYKGVVEELFKASMVADGETAKHAARVMSIAVLLAEKVGISEERIERLKAASLLHDLGKLAVDEKILFKKGKLDEAEFEEIKKHSKWGADVVQLIYFLRDIVPIMANHHENYDGSGYPKGVKGEDIPLEARILGIADIYEALTADRPYRKGFTVDEAAALIESEKEKKLDPRLTDIFLDMVSHGELKEVDI